jgi:hypothetical protein
MIAEHRLKPNEESHPGHHQELVSGSLRSTLGGRAGTVIEPVASLVSRNYDALDVLTASDALLVPR